MSFKDGFRKFSHSTAEAVGQPYAFGLALTSIGIWIACGHIFHYSDTWQLVINTGTTIITFLMVFLIQNSQNRDSRAVHLKLNELLRGVKGARNSMVDLECLTEDELEGLQKEFHALHVQFSSELASRKEKR
ncbi:MAG: low affinity iron permease family protein [Bdellovibrionota bacterium]